MLFYSFLFFVSASLLAGDLENPYQSSIRSAPKNRIPCVSVFSDATSSKGLVEWVHPLQRSVRVSLQSSSALLESLENPDVESVALPQYSRLKKVLCTSCGLVMMAIPAFAFQSLANRPGQIQAMDPAMFRTMIWGGSSLVLLGSFAVHFGGKIWNYVDRRSMEKQMLSIIDSAIQKSGIGTIQIMTDRYELITKIENHLLKAGYVLADPTN